MNGKKAIAFDLETIADRSVVLPEPEVATGNLKDPDKIRAKIEAAKAEQIARMGLDPWTSLICCFGWADGKNSGSILLKDEASEAELLTAAWELLLKYDFFVTFNGIGFDVPMLRAHSLLQSVRPAVDISTRKYQIDNHFDVRAVLGNWDNHAKGSMDFYLNRILGRGKPESINGSLVQDYWDCGAHSEIAVYCEGDARDTWDLYQVVSEYYF